MFVVPFPTAAVPAFHVPICCSERRCGEWDVSSTQRSITHRTRLPLFTLCGLSRLLIPRKSFSHFGLDLSAVVISPLTTTTFSPRPLSDSSTFLHSLLHRSPPPRCRPIVLFQLDRMCGRTASTRPPNVLIRVTGAGRYIPAAPRPGGGAGGRRGGGNNQRGGGQRQRPAPQQRYQQHNQQLEHPSEAEAAEDDGTLGGEEEKEAEEGDVQQYSDAYRPSYNAGPHFYLPVLRYVKNGRDEDDAEEDDSANKASGRTTRRATDGPATAVERQEEKQQTAAEEDFTTDGRDDIPPFDPASTVPPPSPTPTSTPPSTPTGDPSIELVLQPMRWGLIPHWTSATSLAAADAAQSYNMINARAESVDQAKSYRELLKRRRCCVVVDSYYEWHTQTANGRTRKQPFSFIPNHRTPPITETHSTNATPMKSPSTYDRNSNDKPFFLLAGLYDTWDDPSTSSVVYSITILTTSASQKLGWCHERQPVILSHNNALRWLDVWNVPWGNELRAMVCRPWSECVSWYKVPECVGNVRNQISECTQPLEEYMAAKKAAGIGKFFGAAANTPGQAVEQQQSADAKTESTPVKSDTDGVKQSQPAVQTAAAMKQESDAKAESKSEVKVETAGVKAESEGWKKEPATPVKREREDSASTAARTPEKRMKVEGRASRSVSPASGGSAAKREEPVSKSQLSLTSFFGKM